MGLRIQDRGEMVKGNPVVQPADELFWFSRPSFLLYLIQFVLFQNAFQLSFSTWAWVSISIPWHHTARKQIKNQQSSSATPMSSRATTPPTNLSPLRLLPYYKTESGLSNNNRDDDSSSQHSETHVPIEVEGKAGDHQATHLASFSSDNDSRV